MEQKGPEYSGLLLGRQRHTLHMHRNTTVRVKSEVMRPALVFGLRTLSHYVLEFRIIRQ